MKKKILVVDDEMDIRIFISTLVETNGYKSFVAKDGEEGLEMVKGHETRSDNTGCHDAQRKRVKIVQGIKVRPYH